jgi:7-keto-8-aminopelargonate synthetase-like enzyme
LIRRALKDGGDTFRQAQSLGTAVLRPGAVATVSLSDALTAGSGETIDWFRFRVRGRAAAPSASTRIVLAADRWIRSMTLFQASRQRPGRALARLDSVNSVKDLKALTQGEYFIRVAGNAPPAENGLEGNYLGRIQIFTPPSLFQ